MTPVLAIAGLVVKEIVRKKDYYVAGLLILVVLAYASRMPFYHAENTVRYLREAGLGLIFLFAAVLAVPLAVRQYPAERENRTLAVLLSKPVTRFQFVLGKFLGATLGGTVGFAAFFAVFVLFAPPRSGEGWALAFQTVYLYALGLAVLAALGSALSYRFTAAAAVTLSYLVFALFFLYGAEIGASVRGLPGPSRAAATALYFAAPHFEFFDLRQRLIHDWGPVGWDLVAFLTLYAAAYAALFLILAWFAFRKVPAS